MDLAQYCLRSRRMGKSTQLLIPAECCLRQRRGMPLLSWRPWQWCGLLLIFTTICTGTRKEPVQVGTMQRRNVSKVSLEPQRKPLRLCVSRIFTKWHLVFPATDVCTMLEIHKLNTTSYHPQSNGIVERFNWTLIWMLQSHATKYGAQCGRYLPGVLWAY